ncbi:MAG: L,D-transpeptidase family protein [Buchananella hordeovulneris]|nr:L,D-transpeptidase family protein [Buchananella hordeovulneris]
MTVSASSSSHSGVLTGASDASMPSLFRRFWWLFVLGALLVLSTVAAAMHALYWADRALPGTRVAGKDVAGLQQDEIAAIVAWSEAQAGLSLNGDVDAQFSLAELGIDVDEQATAAAALERSAGLWNRFSALWSEGTNISPLLVVDDAALAAATNDLVPAASAKPVDAAIKVSDQGEVEVVPGRPGLKLDAQTVAQAARQAATQLKLASLTVNFTQVPPAITDKIAKDAADTARQLLGTEVALAGEEGNVSPDRATLASWLKITLDAKGSPVLEVNRDAVAAWVGERAKDFTWDPKPGTRKVREGGEVISVQSYPVDGQKVTNLDAVVEQIVASLRQGKAVVAKFETEAVEGTYEDTVVRPEPVAPGTSLAYSPAPGEKWIDIDLSNYLVTAYEGSTVVFGPVYMVSGADVTPTVTGTFRVWGKYASQTMRGENYDGTPYETPDVPWILYFHSGYALHGAYWRDSFGYAGPYGSHGCVNLSVGNAQWLYNWAPVGTVVVSHY